jgi:hypothetical protein
VTDCKRLNLYPDEYARFISACRQIARETGCEFDAVYQHAVNSKIYAGPFYGVVQGKMFAMSAKANLPIK